MARERAIQIRVSQAEYEKIEANARAAGATSLSVYMRAVALDPVAVGQISATDDQRLIDSNEKYVTSTNAEPEPIYVEPEEAKSVEEIDPRLAAGFVPAQTAPEIPVEAKDPEDVPLVADPETAEDFEKRVEKLATQIYGREPGMTRVRAAREARKQLAP